MPTPQYIELDGKLYARYARFLAPIVHYMPKYRKMGMVDMTTSCGRDIDKINANGTVLKRDVTCNTCRRVLGLQKFQFPQVELK